MEEKTRFLFSNFTPRNGVSERVNHILASIVEIAPSDSNYTAVIEQIGNLFHFVITLRSSNGIFDANRTVDTRDQIYRERHWQVGVVSGLYNEMKREIANWHRRRFTA